MQLTVSPPLTLRWEGCCLTLSRLVRSAVTTPTLTARSDGSYPQGEGQGFRVLGGGRLPGEVTRYRVTGPLTHLWLSALHSQTLR